MNDNVAPRIPSPPAPSRRWHGPLEDRWAPFSPVAISALLAGSAVHWCVVGGWALDLWIGRQTRGHSDLEIAIPRDEFTSVRNSLGPLQPVAVRSGESFALAPAELPEPSVHQVWMLDAASAAWRVDVMLEPGDAATWVYRRDPRIRLPRADLVSRDSQSIPFLRPEAVLLFKAKALREKDGADFERTLPTLDALGQARLREWLEQQQPDHPWISRLSSVHTHA